MDHAGRLISACTAGLVAAVPLAGAIAGEQVVTFENASQQIVATLETPDGVAAPPAVLMLHGFTGSRDELAVADTDEGVFSRTARALAEAGIASLRIDFRGSGESGGAWEDTTFSGQVSDALVAFDWLAANPAVDGSRIAVLGWSQGGLVSSFVGEARPQAKAVVQWAPAVEPLVTFSGLLGEAVVASALASPPDEVMTVTLPWGVDTSLRAAFFQEMPTTHPADAIAGYPGPLLVIVGLNDTIVKPQPETGQILLDHHDGVEALAVFETDHVFGAFSGPATLDDHMIPTTIGWLQQFM